MPTIGQDGPVLRLWPVSQAPLEFQQALCIDELDPDTWVAHVPPELLDQALIELLGMNSLPSGHIKTIELQDGSKLVFGVIPNLRSSVAACTTDTIDQNPSAVIL